METDHPIAIALANWICTDLLGELFPPPNKVAWASDGPLTVDTHPFVDVVEHVRTDVRVPLCRLAHGSARRLDKRPSFRTDERLDR
jgi:hypothetical protein